MDYIRIVHALSKTCVKEMTAKVIKNYNSSSNNFVVPNSIFSKQNGQYLYIVDINFMLNSLPNKQVNRQFHLSETK